MFHSLFYTCGLIIHFQFCKQNSGRYLADAVVAVRKTGSKALSEHQLLEACCPPDHASLPDPRNRFFFVGQDPDKQDGASRKSQPYPNIAAPAMLFSTFDPRFMCKTVGQFKKLATYLCIPQNENSFFDFLWEKPRCANGSSGHYGAGHLRPIISIWPPQQRGWCSIFAVTLHRTCICISLAFRPACTGGS